MKFLIWTALTVTNVFLAAQAAPIEVDEDIIPNQFLVQLKPGVSTASFIAHQNTVRDLHHARRDASSALRGLTRTFSAGNGDFNAYSGEFDSSLAAEIAALPEVLLVEPDRYAYPAALITQKDAAWHLGSLSHRAENSTEYVYDDSAGNGGFAYVVDSGIRISHKDFGGRASMGILAGTTYGVAKKAAVIDIKVFGEGGGAVSDIVDGIAWAINDIVSKKRQKNSVINLSLGATSNGILDNAVLSAYNNGILPICAAGNENQDAGLHSPARLPECFTVGNVEKSLKRQSFPNAFYGSNYGRAVDIFAPGTDIIAADANSDTGTKAATGTSDAAPVVAGLALYLQTLEGLKTPAEVTKRIIELSTKDVVTDPKGSQNRLVYNGNA